MKTKLAKQFKSSTTDFRKGRNLINKMLRKYNIDIETYKLSDLYCGELCWVLDKQINTYVEGGTSDITFCLKPLAIGIFEYQPACFYKYVFVGGDYYLNVARGRRFVSDKYNDNIKIMRRDIIVNSSSCKKMMDKFGKDIIEFGYNENSALTKGEIRKLENMLTRKYADYMHGTRFVR